MRHPGLAVIGAVLALPTFTAKSHAPPSLPPKPQMPYWLPGNYRMGLQVGDGAAAWFVLHKDGRFSYSMGGCDPTRGPLVDGGDLEGRYRFVDGMVHLDQTRSAYNFDPIGASLPGDLVVIRWNREVYLVPRRHMLTFVASTRTAWDGSPYADASGLLNFCRTAPVDAPNDGIHYAKQWEWCFRQKALAKTVEVQGKTVVLKPESGTFLKGGMLSGFGKDRDIRLTVKEVRPGKVVCELWEAPSHWARPGMRFEPMHLNG